MKVCPNQSCQHQNVDGAISCQICFGPLNATLLEDPNIPAPPQPDPPVRPVQPVQPTPAPVAVVTPPKAATASFRVVTGSEKGRDLPALQAQADSDEFRIGRLDPLTPPYPDLDLGVLGATQVHRQHAVLRFKNGSFEIEHLGGANGTFVKDQDGSTRLDNGIPRVLKDGETVIIGEVVLEFRSA